MNYYKLIASAAICLLSFAANAQCKFDTDKDEPGFQHIKLTVGPTMLQWKFSLGKKDEKYYLWVYVVDGGIRRHKMDENDHVYIEFENNEKLDLTLPKGEIVKPEFVTTGTTSTTRYDARFEVPKEVMERLSKQNVKEVSAMLDNRDMGRKVKDRQVPNIVEAANCVLK